VTSIVKQPGPPETANPSPPVPRRRRVRRLVLAVAAGLVLVLVAGAAVAVAVLRVRVESAVKQRDLLSAGSRQGGEPQFTLHGPLNFLLLGSDARPGERLGQRSDTIIIVHIPATLRAAYLISIPRDLRVEIPPATREGFSGATDKINSAFAYGSLAGRSEEAGVRLLSATLTELTGIRFDGAAIIDFQGFQQVVRLLGGVDMCVDTYTRSIHTGTVYRPGCRRMAPWEALDYLRQRYDQPNGDYDRQRHQQQFLKAVLAEATRQGLTNPLKLDALLRAMAATMTVDTNGAPLDQLVIGLRDLRASAITGIRVPSYPEMIDGTSYVLPYPAADSLFAALRTDRLGAWALENKAWINHL
jgi:LCP family protein required for cell wall assembly